MPPPAFEPVEPERYEAGLGPAAGCLLGLALGAVLWTVMIGAAWWLWTLIVR